ncbi:MAG: branched-chain amino acid ABC transporter permease [Solirubrobacterales bacterium]
MEIAQFSQLLISGLIVGGIYALIAAGFIIVFNVTGILNFAQGEFVMLGALISVTGYKAGLPLALAVLLAVAAVTVAGIALELLAIRPAGNATPVTFIIITIGVSIAIRGFALLNWGTDSYTLPAFSAGSSFDIFSVKVGPQGIWILAATAACFGALIWFFERTYAGKAVRACVINPQAARLMGISPKKMSLLAFAMAGAMGALAGATITPMTSATYDMGLMLGLKGFVAAALGGLTSIPAALLGGLLLGVIETLGAGFISSGFRDAIAFFILAVILFVRPEGLLGAIGGKRV